MYTIYQLTKRNMLLYFRDRSAVFFSLLSVLIVLMLMLVFLGDMNKQELMELIENAQGSISEADADHVIVMWTIAGILSVIAFTVPVTMVGMYVTDKENHKLESLYTAPVSRGSILCSYMASSIITSVIMSALLLLLSFAYVSYSGYAFLSFAQLLQVTGLLLLNIGVSSALILILAQCVKSDHAWGAFSTLAGTLIGFVGGIYLPMGMLPVFVQKTLKAMPFIHETALLRSVFTQQPIETAFQNLPDGLVSGYQEAMGIVIKFQDQTISLPIQVIGLCLCGIIALFLSVFLLKRHSNFDR